MQQEPSDRDLIGRYQAEGDIAALDELLRRHIARVRNLIGPMVRNEADADDLTQQTLVRAVRGLPKFQGRAAFTTWLHRIALNTTYTFLERRRRRHAVGVVETDATAPAHEEPGRALESKESLRRIDAAMAELPPSFRAALLMTVVQDLPVRDAAAAEGVTAATMHWRVHKARKALRALLESERAEK